MNENILANIYHISSADEILNRPGQLYFYFDFDESKFKSGQRLQINNKEMKKISDNVILVFENILKMLKSTLSDEEKSYFSKIIKKLENYNHNSKSSFSFPGLQVVNLTKLMVKPFCLYSHRILICEKSDGVRYFLITFRNGKCLFFNRKEQFFTVELSSPLPSSESKADDWEIENILDGELILDKVFIENDDQLLRLKDETNLLLIKKQGEKPNKDLLYKFKFVAFDAIVLRMEQIGYLPFRSRLERLSRFGKEIEFKKFQMNYVKEKFNNKFTACTGSFLSLLSSKATQSRSQVPPSIEVFIKDYFTFDHIASLYKMSKSPKFPHLNDGIILNYDDYPYYPGVSDEVFKWKPAHLNTIDFEIKEKDGLMVMNIAEGREKLLPVSCLFFKDKEEKECFEQEYNKMKLNSTNAIIAECFYDKHHITKETTNLNLLSKLLSCFKRNDSLTINLDNYDKNFIDNYEKNKANYELGGWRFLRFRNDKYHANYIKTYTSILQTIEEDLDIDSINREINNSKELKSRTPEFVLNECNKIRNLTGNSSFLNITGFTMREDVKSPFVNSEKNTDEVISHFKVKTKEVNHDFLNKKKTNELDLKKETKDTSKQKIKDEESIEYLSMEDFSEYN